MCGGGGGGGRDPVAYQREQENKRQQKIQQGKKQLDLIFAPLEGQRVVSRRVPVTYNGSTTGKIGADGKPLMTTERVVVDDPNKDPIWQRQQRAYQDFAQPQLQDEYRRANKDLGFALARQGQTESSLAGERTADLNRDYKVQQQAMLDKARGYGNQARADIARQKQSLLTMLNSTADPGAAATAARDQVAALGQTPEFSPIGPMFQNVTAGMAAGYGGYQNSRSKQATQDIVYGSDPGRSSARTVR